MSITASSQLYLIVSPGSSCTPSSTYHDADNLEVAADVSNCEIARFAVQVRDVGVKLVFLLNLCGFER